MRSGANARGTALIESLLATVALVTLVSGGLGVAYFCFARVWLDRTSYETLICLSTRDTVRNCETRMRKNAGDALLIGRLVDVHLRRSRREATVSYRFELESKTLIRGRSTIRLPLVTGKGRT